MKQKIIVTPWPARWDSGWANTFTFTTIQFALHIEITSFWCQCQPYESQHSIATDATLLLNFFAGRLLGCLCVFVAGPCIYILFVIVRTSRGRLFTWLPQMMYFVVTYSVSSIHLVCLEWYLGFNCVNSCKFLYLLFYKVASTLVRFCF